MKKILMGLLCGVLLLSACSKAEPAPEVIESPKATTEQTNETVYTDVFEEFVENAPIDSAYQRDLEQGEKVYADIVKDYHENWKAEYYGTKEQASLYFDEQAAKELSAHLENWEKELEAGWNWQQEHYFLSDRSTYGTQVYDDQLKSLGDQYRAKSLWLKEMYYHAMKNDEDILAWYQDEFEFQVADGEVIIHRYCGEAESVEIPETLVGYPVRELWESSFYQCTGLREITMPATLTKLPDYNVFVYPDEITLLVEQGSAAEQYAKTHELHYKLLD